MQATYVNLINWINFFFGPMISELSRNNAFLGNVLKQLQFEYVMNTIGALKIVRIALSAGSEENANCIFAEE